MGEMRCEYKVFNGKMGRREGKRPLPRPRRRWEDHILTDLQEVGWERGLDSCGSG